MLQELVALAPNAIRQQPGWVAFVVLAAAVGFWGAGGRFSRYLITLGLAAAGALVGMRLPRWWGWSVDGIGIGMGAALLLGVSGFLLDKAWMGTLLGLLIAFWAAVIAWAWLEPSAQWVWPGIQWTHDPVDLGLQVFRMCPPGLRSSLPGGAVSGMGMGLVITLFWPRMSRAILFDLLGLSLVVAVVLPIVEQQQPGWMNAHLPQGPAQPIGVLILFLAGLGVQWFLLGREDKAPAAKVKRSGKPEVRSDLGGPDAAVNRQPIYPGAANHPPQIAPTPPASKAA
jgi:hypothetical protein